MVINKAAKRVDILIALQHTNLKGTTLEIYFAFVRPIFEYGCVIWYNAPRHDFLFNEMERFHAYHIWTLGGPNYLNDVNIIVCFYFTTYYTA